MTHAENRFPVIILFIISDDKCMRELERRLLSDHMLDDTMKMINYCIILGPRSCLTYFNTGVLLRTLCDKVKKKHVPVS